MRFYPQEKLRSSSQPATLSPGSAFLLTPLPPAHQEAEPAAVHAPPHAEISLQLLSLDVLHIFVLLMTQLLSTPPPCTSLPNKTHFSHWRFGLFTEHRLQAPRVRSLVSLVFQQDLDHGSRLITFRKENADFTEALEQHKLVLANSEKAL